MSLPKPYYQDASITIYNSRCEEILPHLGKFDAIITDPPYSEKTHAGHDGGSTPAKDGSGRAALGYASLSPEDCRKFARIFSESCAAWVVWMTDHTLTPHINAALESEGRYVFAPLPFFAPGSRVRLSGDGPSSWTDWIIVSRTAAQSKWGTLPGGYVSQPGWDDKVKMGGKPTRLMQCLVRDYSRPGDRVCDPFCGSGTTLLAAKNLGRKAVGIDSSEADCEISARRMEQEVLPFDVPAVAEEPHPELFV